MATVPVPVTRVNHLVLKVRDIDRSVAFYSDVFGMSEGVPRFDGPQSVKMAFLRVADGTNHHDLGLLEVGPDAPSVPDGAVGLFHFWGTWPGHGNVSSRWAGWFASTITAQASRFMAATLMATTSK